MTSPVARLALSSIRRQLVAVLALAVVIGVVCGVALGSLAGARRTASAFTRFLDASNASDDSVDIFATDAALEADPSLFSLQKSLDVLAKAEQIEGIASSATYVGMESMFNQVDGRTARPSQSAEVIGSLDGRFLDQDRAAVLDGALPRADAIDEVFINTTMARLFELNVGDPITLEVRDNSKFEGDELPPIEALLKARITGVGLVTDDVLVDEYDQLPRIVLTPAATRKYLDLAGSYLWHGIRLAPGTSEEKVLDDYRKVAGSRYNVIVKRTADQLTSVQQAVHPLVTAIAAFGLISLLAALALAALGSVRLAGDGPETRSLRALGLRPRQLAVVFAAPGLAACLTGAALSVVVAVALSPFAPLGAVRDVEPHRGAQLDAFAVGVGVGVFAAVAMVASLVTGWRHVRRTTVVRAPRATPSGLERALSRARPTLAIGTRHALSAEGSGAGAPTRTTAIACAVGVLAIVSALTFTANVSQLLDHPDRYGWWPDIAFVASSGYDYLDPEGAAKFADAHDEITGLSVAAHGLMQLDRRTVPVVATADVKGHLRPTVISGRAPQQDDEVALGARTARDLHVRAGDTLSTAGDPLRVVGIVSLPAIGQISSAHTSLDSGALLTLDGLMMRNDNAYPDAAFVDLAPGVNPRARATALALELGASATQSISELMDGYPVAQRPAELADGRRSAATAALLAGLVVLASVVALALTVATSVRRRAREHAILKVLGFVRRDIRRTVRWQALAIVAAAFVVGVPLGIIAGRYSWQAFADSLGVSPQTVLPVGWVAVALLVLAGLALLAASVPARTAARTRAAVLLRQT